MTFEQAVAFVLRPDIEGEWGAVPGDPGGRTRWGISTRAHPDVDLTTLTREGAVELYRARYWRVAGCDRVPPPFRLPLFDAAVQHGPTQAVRLLQDAAGVTRDGVIGPRTLAALTALPWSQLLVRVLTLRLRFYAGLDGWAISKGGWSHRLFALQAAVYDSQLQGGTS